MNQATQSFNHVQQTEYTPREDRLLQTLRLLNQLDVCVLEETEQFVWSLVARHLKWNYEDPASLERAMAFAALDPFLRAESQSISEDFAAAEADGLEEY